MGPIGMIPAFLVFCGVGLLICNALKVKMGEGMLLSASAIVLLLFVSGKAGSFWYGFSVLCACGVAGILLTAYRAISGRGNARALLLSPCLLTMTALFLYFMVVYYRDFIQHYDEWHQWALAVKLMARAGNLVTDSPLYMDNSPYGSTLFHVFFQLFSGYSEKNMYVSSGFLMWTGFLLPFAGSRREDWKRVAMYSVILYFAVFSIYQYGMKNVYVDLPVIAWCGGLAGWWRVREKKKTDYLIVGSTLAMVCCFKWLAGPLIAAFALLFMLTHTLVLEMGVFEKEHRKRAIWICAAVGAAVLIAVVIFAAVRGPELFAQLEDDRLEQAGGIFLTYTAGKALAPSSGLKLAFLPLLALILVLMYVAADLFGEKKAFRTYAVYMGFTAVAHLLILLYAYLFIFTYGESLRMACGLRYLALYSDFIFVIVLAWLFQGKCICRARVYRYLSVGLLLLFLSGVNEKFIPTMTALDKTRIPGYKKITRTREQTEAVQAIAGPSARVYLLAQKGSDEYVTNTALYYLEEQVSNYLSEVWRFTETGSSIWVTDLETPTLSDFPQILADGGYDYVWIAQNDSYLKKKLPKVLNCGSKTADEGLYRVIYEDGAVTGLTKIWEYTEE